MSELFKHFDAESLFQWFLGLTVVIAFIRAFMSNWTEIHKWTKNKVHEENENKTRLESIEQKIDTIVTRQSDISDKIKILMESDKESIKNFILEKYALVIERGSITLREKEVIMKKYNAYVQEHGNSFISEIVDEIKELPVQN